MTYDWKKLEEDAILLKGVSHPLRIRIVELLIQLKELSVKDICYHLKSEQSLTSHHLNTMKGLGLLQSRKEQQKQMYSLKSEKLTPIIDCIDKCTL